MTKLLHGLVSNWNIQMNLKKLTVLALTVGLGFLLQGCSGGSSSSGPGSMRVVNATHSHASIDVLNGTTSLTAGVTKGAASDYFPMSSTTTMVSLVDSATQLPIATANLAVGSGLHTAVLAYDVSGSVKTLSIEENDTAPAAGQGAIRVVDAAGSAGNLDIYITSPGTPLAAVSPVYSVGGTLMFTQFSTLPTGNYEIRVTPTGSPSNIMLDIPAVALASQQSVNVVLIPSVGGGLLDGGLLAEQGVYTPALNSNARIRVASGASVGSVTATYGAISLTSSMASPFVSEYAVVPSGSNSINISVGGSNLSPTINLAAGSDNTLLITQSQSTYAANVLSDDNALPGSSGINIRLINAVTDLSAGLSLSADFSLVASNVLAGQASPYTETPGDNNMRLEVDGPTTSSPIYLITGQNIPANAVYSVFVLGSAAAPQTIVRKDQ